MEDEITRDLHNITLYTAGSIESSGTGLAFTDGTTRSTLFEGLEPFYPIVKEAEGRVLAIHDFTFLVPPQNSILDNDRLVSNIADFLTDSRREFELADFPHFFKDDIDILLGGADLFELGTDFKGLLSDFQINSEVRGIEDLASNTVYLGLYPNSVDVAQYLEVAGIQVNDVLRTPFTPRSRHRWHRYNTVARDRGTARPGSPGTLREGALGRGEKSVYGPFQERAGERALGRVPYSLAQWSLRSRNRN